MQAENPLLGYEVVKPDERLSKGGYWLMGNVLRVNLTLHPTGGHFDPTLMTFVHGADSEVTQFGYYSQQNTQLSAGLGALEDRVGKRLPILMFGATVTFDESPGIKTALVTSEAPMLIATGRVPSTDPASRFYAAALARFARYRAAEQLSRLSGCESVFTLGSAALYYRTINELLHRETILIPRQGSQSNAQYLKFLSLEKARLDQELNRA